MGEQSQTPVRVLALVYALGAALSLVSSLWPLDARSPVAALRWLGAAGLLLAWLVLVAGRRWPGAVAHVGSLTLSALVGLSAAGSVTAVGVVGLGPVVIAVSLYAAHTFPVAAGRAHVAFVVASASAGASLSTAGGFAIPWVVLVVAAVAVFEVHGLLVRRLRVMAALDPLTGVANRRWWEQAAQRDLAQAGRSGRAFSVLLIDLDGFKQVNDTQGHAAGDALLRELTVAWGGVLRRGDLLGRYGGDEFVVSLPGTGVGEGRGLVERLRARHPMAWSAGLAVLSGQDTLGELLARADEDLYTDKQRGAGGRDRHRHQELDEQR